MSDGGPVQHDLFGARLAEAFRRRRPQGSARWNFEVAFALLEEQFAEPEPNELAAADLVVSEGAQALPLDGARRSRRLRGAAERVILSRLANWVDQRAAAVAAEVTDRTLKAGLGRTGVAQSVEALRFLGVRVAALEAAAHRRRSPVPALEALVHTPAIDDWLEPLAELVRTAMPPGPLLHGECGDGALVERLGSAGVDATGVEPRGPLAWEASRRKIRVEIGGVHSYLASLAEHSVSGIVLSGIVDRAPLEDLVALVDTVRISLTRGGLVVVVGSHPHEAASGWSAVAHDLAPGRPLHPETWALLLSRAGMAGIHALEPLPDTTPATYALAGRVEP